MNGAGDDTHFFATERQFGAGREFHFRIFRNHTHQSFRNVPATTVKPGNRLLTNVTTFGERNTDSFKERNFQ